MAERHVHGDGGAYVGGHWVDIEDCDKHYNMKSSGCPDAGVKCAACPRSRSRHSAAKADGSYDIVIIGAGCVGSAIARELSKTTASVLLLEGADDVTQGATKGNSGIIHAGFDDKPGSVRAKYCWPGNQMFPQLDRELHFGYQATGSLVVAKTQDDLKTLDDLVERGKKNGVKNLRIVGQEELRKLEPHIGADAIAALHSPDAGTITPYEYTIALAENAVANGVEIRTRRVVSDIAVVESSASGPPSFVVTAKHWEPPTVASSEAKSAMFRNLALAALYGIVAALVGAGLISQGLIGPNLVGLGIQDPIVYGVIGLISAYCVLTMMAPAGYVEKSEYSPSPGTVLTGLATTEKIKASYVINAAGCSSDKIASMVGDASWHVKPRFGEYILLHKEQGDKARHVLFPCPHPVFGKGVLVQSTLWGNLILGPTARDTMMKNEATGAYEPNPAVKSEPKDNIMGYILSKCRALVPDFDAGAVIHTFAGVRAKNTTGDWVIGPVKGVPSFINAASIDSPGIAASPAIAVDVVQMLMSAGAPVSGKNPSFNPNRAPLVVPKPANGGLRGLKMSKNDFWKEKDPSKNVICKCERVTEAEVIEALRRSLPIDSTQAIRKRTRAGMGHCQGDPDNYNCEQRVAEIIARETGLPLEAIGRRPWPASSMMSKRLFDAADKDHLKELSIGSKHYVLAGAAD